MSLDWDPRRERPPAREPQPQEPPASRAPAHAALLALQRSGGNQAVASLIQRWKTRDDLGPDYVEFDETEPLPHRIRGTLASDPGYQYTAEAGKGERIYKRTAKQAADPSRLVIRDSDEVARERKVNQLKTANETLFNAAQGGGKEGTFEYVANYLFTEVFKTDQALAQTLWDEIWEVREPKDSDPVAVRRDIDERKFLQRLIDAGLDAGWKKVPVDQLVRITVKDKDKQSKPASSMPVVVWEFGDYFSSLYNWSPWPETSGVGFHTTDGGPDAVGKPKAQGGWGGLTQTAGVEFFKKRYALDQGWNPLKSWIDEHGPAFRKGIKDNELLSTVSVATAIHGSVRFPLADTPGRKGTHKVLFDGAETFKMEVYIYAVRIGSGYATFEKQGAANAFGEIATGDIPIEDIIGWSKITRHHPYAKDTGLPLTIGFDYKMTPFTRNPAYPVGGIHERVYAQALAEINKEIALTGKPYEG